ncbi:MAG: replication-associated recombination protein A [Nitrospirae bacterium]|nr:replication-associated recombination protein A [Nitrospirota bacterium]
MTSRRDALPLFSSPGARGTGPLADRLRPETLDELVGQPDLAGIDAVLRRWIDEDAVPSLVLWGPPGCGKTSAARVVQRHTRRPVVAFSAVASGVKDVRAVLERAEAAWKGGGPPTLVFIDELHHFTKVQQDIFLPHVEEGSVVLLATTTENPSFHVIGPLLSRCQVLILRRLSEEDLSTLLRRGLTHPRGGLTERKVEAVDEVLGAIASAADGDARRALNVLDLAARATKPGDVITAETVRRVLGRRVYLYDRDREEHYNVISAFIKSVRGSNPDAAIYWLARMLESGEDPLFIARRMIILASEDIGNADPRALPMAVAAMHAVDFIGLPEGTLPLAQAAAYLASAPKSNAAYRAYLDARADVARHGSLPVPQHLRNAVTSLMEGAGYGRGYLYPHDDPGGIVAQTYLPEALSGRSYYRPKSHGAEREIADRLREWERMRAERGAERPAAESDGIARSGSALPPVEGKPRR